MASEKVLMKRAQLAASFSRVARMTAEGKTFVEALMEGSPEQAELVVVPAASEEPAVLTFHRIERLHVPVVVLVTNDGDKLVARNLLWSSQEAKLDSFTDISSEVTTSEWMKSMEENPGQSFAVTGSEFSARINSLATLTVA
ncbi:hypothetical protein QM007_06315 [Rothia sp. SD9660Na]|uniref:hypothetical protein n=1 Tax=Rothia sp. SD9660Na TaxID=3047030 RepID=UPI0024BB446D|nr:hypothetical protein [Rothia sp. SD9660Na]WHS49544.1 hypothetical protein QM007_06315 [Rothia sp. SD9660Na]